MIEYIGKAAMLEQLAEEAAELAQAALKCARIERGEKSYHELIYLNGTPRGNLSEMQIIAMRRKQTKWIGTTILASVMLSMHRMYGFGADRDTALMNQIAEIENEYGGNGSRIVEALREETGVEFTQKGAIAE